MVCWIAAAGDFCGHTATVREKYPCEVGSTPITTHRHVPRTQLRNSSPAALTGHPATPAGFTSRLSSPLLLENAAQLRNHKRRCDVSAPRAQLHRTTPAAHPETQRSCVSADLRCGFSYQRGAPFAGTHRYELEGLRVLDLPSCEGAKAQRQADRDGVKRTNHGDADGEEPNTPLSDSNTQEPLT